MGKFLREPLASFIIFMERFVACMNPERNLTSKRYGQLLCFQMGVSIFGKRLTVNIFYCEEDKHQCQQA